jgi:hypothetical protein
MDEQNQEQRKGLIRKEWFDRIALGAAAVLIYQALVVLVNSISLTWFEEHVLPKWHWPNSAFDSVFIGFFGLIALILLLRSLGVGLKWSRNIWVPTLQVSVVWAVLLLLAGAWWQGDIGRVAAFGCVLPVYIVICCISAFVLDWLRPNPVRDTSVATAKKLEDLTYQDFKDWLGDDAPTDRYDFCNRTLLVDRMYNRLDSSQTSGQRGQILFGDYGSGKSTVIKLLQQKLENNKKKRWLVVRFDTWGRSESPADITSMILDSILEAIHSSGVETISLLDASNRYIQAAFHIESRLSVLGILSARQSPDDILKEVNHILLLNNLGMLVIIEDADRCHDADKVIDTIAGLLDRIAHLSACRFILTLKREAVKSDTALKLADFMEDIDAEITPSILKYFFDYCMNKVYGDSESIVRRIQENHWSLGLDSDKRIGKNFDKIRQYLVNIRSIRLVFKATLDRWLTLKGNAIFQDVFLAQIIRHEKRLENDRVQLLSPVDWIKLSEQSVVDDDPVKYQKNIQIKLQLPRSNKTASGFSEPTHPEFRYSVIGKLVDQPLIFSIHDPSIVTSNDSLLELVSHRTTETGTAIRSFFDYLHPEYWRDVFGLSVNCESHIIEFINDLNRVAKNPHDHQSELIGGLIFFEDSSAAFLENFFVSGSSSFMSFDSMCGLTEHFIQSDYENPYVWSEIYKMRILNRSERSIYAGFISYILRLLTRICGRSDKKEEVMGLLCRFERKFEEDSIADNNVKDVCIHVREYIDNWFHDRV